MQNTNTTEPAMTKPEAEIIRTIKAIDFELLKRQKEYLLNLKPCEELDGLINMIDAIQDAAEPQEA